MIKIKIILMGSCNVTHFLRHISAVVTDVASGQSLVINYPFSSNATGFFPGQPAERNVFNDVQPSCRTGVVKLYAKRNFQTFYQKFLQHFGDPHEFSWPCHNCSSAVGYVLNYFFPWKKFENISYTLLQLVTGIGCIATLGLCAYIPALPFIKTPQDVFNRAKLLSVRHGKPRPSNSLAQPATQLNIPTYQGMGNDWVTPKLHR